MSPAAIAALVTVGLRLIDMFEERSGGSEMDQELLDARTALRRELANQASQLRDDGDDA